MAASDKSALEIVQDVAVSDESGEGERGEEGGSRDGEDTPLQHAVPEACEDYDEENTNMYLQAHTLGEEYLGFKPASNKATHTGLRRYRRGLKNAIPVRTAKSPKHTLPLDTNGLINYMTFGWLTPYMWTVFRKGTASLSSVHVSEQEGAEINARRMYRFWSAELAERGQADASFGRAIFKSFKTRLIIGAFISLLHAVLMLANPIFVIRYFLAYLSEEEVRISTGLVYVLALAVVLLLRGLSGAFFWMLNLEAAARIKYGSLALLYAKVLRLKSLRDKTVGDLINLISNDGQRLWNGIVMGPFIIGGPMILLISCIYGVIFLGPWALLSFFVIIGFFPFAVTLARLSQRFRARSIKITDKRVGLMVELLTSIKLIKMYAWEMSFARKITDIRAEEKSVLEKSLFVQSVNVGSSMLVPLMASCLTFIGYVATGNNLTATQAFTFVSLLNTIQASMATLPFALKAVSEMVVTTRRIQEILLMEEMKPYPKLPASSPNMVEMVGATFSWSGLLSTKNEEEDKTGKTNEDSLQGKKRKRLKRMKNTDTSSNEPEGKGGGDEKQNLKEDMENTNPIFVGPTLRNFTFTLKKGHLLGVCGNVASGKTSFINAILGKMDLTSGTVTVSGQPVAYVPQQAWLTQGTLRENILFGEPYEEDRYHQVVQACALTEDFASFPSGDVTQIGECGSTLSGGQKQRLSLARAAYSKHDLVLLDDPLSAVDIHLARHIFQECILAWFMGRGKQGNGSEEGTGRTVVFVSHLIEYMKECDQILVIKDGTIAEQGSHKELLTEGNSSSGSEQVSEEGRKSSVTSGDYAFLLRLYQEYQATQGSEPTQQSHQDGEGGETTMLNESGDMTQMQNSIVSSERKVLDEGFPARVPDVVSDHNSNGVHYKPKIETITPYEAGSSKKELKAPASSSHSDPAPLIEEEQVDTGALSLSVVQQWILSMGGYPVLLLVFIIFCLPVAGTTTASWYLSYWIEQGGGMSNGTLRSPRVVDNPDLSCYLLIYASFIPVLVSLTLVRSFSLVKATIHASSALHNTGFQKILHRPLSFFYTTPVGRIVNRFSADQDEMDLVLPLNIEVFTNNVLQVIAALIAVSYVSPWFALAVIPLAVLFLILMVIFHVCFRRLKCLDHVTRSPVLAHFGASVQGLEAVQAYGVEREFSFKQCQLLDSNCVALLLFQTASRWLALRLELVSAGVALITGLLILTGWDHLNPALAGLALAFTLQMSGLFQFTARLAVETEARFTSVQRMLEYCNDDTKEPIATSRLKTEWPVGGSILFQNVSLRYGSDAPLALSDVSFEAKSQQKIGIVGRSGAGKSSLAVALFRLFEVESGQICVDGQDIHEIPLDQLRPALSIIPQDPVLFAGTLRYNLDPFNKLSDVDLWQAIDRCHLSDLVRTSNLQLETAVSEGGNNFSVGERQLLCLARALLKRSKILILDEATAAVDSETDALIQATLRDAFQECTMLVIAHRLATVLHCDKILVMEAGKTLEFDTPTNLMSNQGSKFKAMIKALEHSL